MTLFIACETGNLDWLRRQKASGTLPKLMQKTTGDWYPHELAAANGHLEVLKWLVLESGQHVNLTADHSYTVQCAALNGHLDVVKWLVKESGQPVDVTADDHAAVQSTAANGKLEVIRWLVEESGQPVDVTANQNIAVRSAAFYGYHAVVRWLVEESGQPVDVTALDESARKSAVNLGYFSLARYLDVVAQLGLSNFRTAMCALDGNVNAVKAPAPLVASGLTLTEADVRALAQPLCAKQPTSARRL